MADVANIINLTWFDANSWLIEVAGQRILLDPWLVGDLVFGNLPWLVRGSRPQPIEIPQNIDLILLSQGLADHAHPETLQQLDNSIPVVASPDGAEIALSLGFASVTLANHGDTIFPLGDRTLEIRTLKGAVVGPMKRENGYVLTFATGGRLYYEPHGYPDTAHLADIGSVDVVITPIADVTLMGIAPVVKGGDIPLQIAQMLKPQVMLPTAEAGRVTYDGLISQALQTTGGVAELRSRLEADGKNIRVIQPVPEERIELDLQRAVTVL